MVVSSFLFSPRSLGNGFFRWVGFPQSKNLGENNISKQQTFAENVPHLFSPKLLYQALNGGRPGGKNHSSATSLRFSVSLNMDMWHGASLPPILMRGPETCSGMPICSSNFFGGERKDGLCKMLLKLLNINDN